MNIERLQAQSLIEDFFTWVLNGDKAVLALIKASTGNVYFKSSQLEFDLPSLYSLIFPQQTLRYVEFKAALYGGDLNSNLMKKGARVVLGSAVNERNKIAVDVNLYYLQLNKQ